MAFDIGHEDLSAEPIILLKTSSVIKTPQIDRDVISLFLPPNVFQRIAPFERVQMSLGISFLLPPNSALSLFSVPALVVNIGLTVSSKVFFSNSDIVVEITNITLHDTLLVGNMKIAHAVLFKTAHVNLVVADTLEPPR